MKSNSSKTAQLSTPKYLESSNSRFQDESELLDETLSTGDVYEWSWSSCLWNESSYWWDWSGDWRRCVKTSF